MPVTGTIDNDAALLRPLCPFMTDILPASFGANIVLSLCNVQRRPLTARLSQYPLRSESDQSAALPRIDAMHRNKRRANAVENGQAAVVGREISRLIRHSLTLRTVAAPLFQA